MQATSKLGIVLEAQQWQQILEILQKTAIPYTISAPIIIAIMQQAQEAEQANGLTSMGDLTPKGKAMTFIAIDTQQNITGTLTAPALAGPVSLVSDVGITPTPGAPLPPDQDLSGWYSMLIAGAETPVVNFLTILNDLDVKGSVQLNGHLTIGLSPPNNAITITPGPIATDPITIKTSGTGAVQLAASAFQIGAPPQNTLTITPGPTTSDSVNITSAVNPITVKAAGGTSMDIVVIQNNPVKLNIAPPLPSVRLLGPDGNDAAFMIDASGISGSGGGGFFMSRSYGGFPAAPTPVQAGQRMGGLRATGYGTTKFGTARTVIQTFAAETFTDTAQGAYISIATTAIGSVSTVERMRITDAGNVLIGTTTNATGRLQIAGSTTGGSTQAQVQMTGQVGGGWVGIVGNTLDPVANPLFLSAQRGGLGRWQLEFGGGPPEAGSNMGTDFVLTRFNDAGGVIDQPLSVIRQTGEIRTNGMLTVTSAQDPGGFHIVATGSNWPALDFNTTNAGSATGYIQANRNGVPRWTINLGNPAAETGGNAGANFGITNFNDGGLAINNPTFSISRATGALVNVGPVSVGAGTNNTLTIASGATAADSVTMTSTGTAPLKVNGSLMLYTPLEMPRLIVQTDDYQDVGISLITGLSNSGMFVDLAGAIYFSDVDWNTGAPQGNRFVSIGVSIVDITPTLRVKSGISTPPVSSGLPGTSLAITAATGGGTGNGGPISIVAGAGGSGGGVGGSLTLRSGLGATTGNKNGGDIFIQAGRGGGSGAPGNIIVTGLPTSAPAVSGAIWLNNGVMTVVP